MHKHTKMYVFRFKVEGRGQFPFDMLRYDTCFPATQDDVGIMVRGAGEHGFNELGFLGWELVAISEGYAYFKCPKLTINSWRER